MHQINNGRPRILFVEDDAVLREHLAASLSDEFQVDTAGDGEQALRVIMKARPDLVIADIDMPGRDGGELRETLRNTSQTETLPVLLICDRAPDELRIQGSEHGLDAYLAKPYSELELRARIRSVLKDALQIALERERETNALMDELFASAPIGLAFVDRDLRFRRINARLAQMNGLSVEAHLGKRPDELLPDLDDLDTILAKWGEVIEHGEPWLGVEVEGETPAAPGQGGVWLESFFPVRVAGRTTGLGVIAQDITQQKATERELRQSQDRYRAFVRLSSEGIWRYELDVPLDISLPIEEQVEHVYRYARLAELNDAMARMYGYERAEELVGAPLARTLPADDEGARAYLRSMAQSGYSLVNVESAEPDRDGRIHYFENSVVPVIENGRLLRVWGVQREISERKEAEDRLKQADRRKDEFLALLAHELRNPLAPIRNGIQIFKLRATGDELLQRTARMMDRQMAHLVRLVDDLLDVSRITHGKLDLRMQPLRLADVLSRAIEASRPFIETKGHELIVEVRAPDVHVNGDADRLVQVFANLLSNSAKYTQNNGRITLTLDRTEHEALVTVEDTGIGITPEAIEGVFKMFSQVDAARGRSGEGLGIGLSLARTLLDMHHGTIRADSAGAGLGSTFSVRLPTVGEHTVEPARQEPTSPSAAPEKIPPLRVIVADDNDDAAQSLAMLLAGDGHEVRTAADGEQAVALAREFAPDVIFMDVGMPGMDGLAATKAIRALPQGRHVRIVAVTGWGQAADRQKTAEAGMDHHLTKPVDIEALKETLSTLAQGSLATRVAFSRSTAR